MYDGVTVYLPDQDRGDEILDFVRRYNIEEYMVLDDNHDGGEGNEEELEDRWYDVDPRFGLTKTLSDELIVRICRHETEKWMLSERLSTMLADQWEYEEKPRLEWIADRWLNEGGGSCFA